MAVLQLKDEGARHADSAWLGIRCRWEGRHDPGRCQEEMKKRRTHVDSTKAWDGEMLGQANAGVFVKNQQRNTSGSEVSNTGVPTESTVICIGIVAVAPGAGRAAP